MIESLADPEEFRRLRNSAWQHNIDYWVTAPLRHVVDVGGYILERVSELCGRTGKDLPVVLDMGFGSAWLLQDLIASGVPMSYVGLDSMEPFVVRAKETFGENDRMRFLVQDVEKTFQLPVQADVVVNAFNFFELSDLHVAMRNVRNHLRVGGSLFMSTIDKTYLILALNSAPAAFCENLRRYQEIEGTKYAFQRIDLGAKLSETLEYPSVLYSTQDFIDAAAQEDLRLVNYAEHAFTAKAVPKIYCHMEFERV